MPDAVLIFTFSPVQPFIMEARRAADLFAGSRILVELAKAAASVVQEKGGHLIFPASAGDDVPNKLVAIVPAQTAGDIAADARTALLERWEQIGSSARGYLSGYNPSPDNVWREIWERQTSHLWEVYWAAATMANGDKAYADAYARADAALNAAKRTRAFAAAEEPGPKDSLSGQREALHTGAYDARRYWATLASAAGMTAAKLRPEGRERLDAIAAIKRFSNIAEEQAFPSTSTVASEDFWQRVQGLSELGAYRRTIEKLIDQSLLYRVRSDAGWPYDGDLFYPETLTPNRLKDSYGADAIANEQLRATQKTLRELHGKAGRKPSPYYAVMALDGDSMGARISDCLKAGDPLNQHQKLSQDLALFAGKVKGEVEAHLGSLVYNGGDDVLLMAPLSEALPVAQGLAQTFLKTTGGTASAGIAIAHHLYPLDAVLAAAREAEQVAKRDYGRNAVCILAIKRSGEKLRVGSRWAERDLNLGDVFPRMVAHFQEGRLSSRFAYDLAEQAQTVTALAVPAQQATLKRLVNRHKTKLLSADDANALTDELQAWATVLDDCVPSTSGVTPGFAELGRWLILAHFVARGGDE